VTVSIVVLKMIGTKNFKWQNIEFSISDSWIVLLLLTLAHLYVGILVIRSAHALWKDAPHEKCVESYNDLVATGNILIRGLVPRVNYFSSDHFGLPTFSMALDDPATWSACALGLLILAAAIPFQRAQTFVEVEFVSFAVLLLLINWRVGANWIVAISALSDERDKAFYFHFLERKVPFRVHEVTSGITIPEEFFWAIAALGLQVLFIILFFFAGPLISTLAKYGMAFIAVGVFCWNVDLANLSKKFARRINLGPINDMETYRITDKAPLLIFLTLPVIVWVWDIVERVYPWVKSVHITWSR
jgi:hypothetical protein